MLIEDASIVQSPIISVVVITYNQEKYISQCIDAILRQEVNVKFEVIIAEDAGTDNTRDICIRYQHKNPTTIRLLLQDKNQGISKNYYDVLSLARGRYIAQVAGDDYWCNPHKLQYQYDYMFSHPQCGLSYTDVMSCDENGKILCKDYLKGKPLSQSFKDHLLSSGFMAPLSWMFLKEIAGMYEDKGFVDESVAIALDAFANYEVAHLPICSAVYRLHNGSASSFISANQYFQQSKGVFDTRRYYARKYNCSEELVQKMLTRGYLEILPIAIAANNEDFVNEAQSYLESQNLDVSLIIRELRQGEMRKQSKAYRIGKMILKPLKWLQR